MESNLTTCVQGVDSNGEAIESSPVCLCVPLILQKILQHIPTAELVAFSLVNKQWNYEARGILRDRGSLIAKLNTGNPSRNLEAFLSDLRQMNIVPFSGIRLDVITVGGLDIDECNRSWLDSSPQLLDSIQSLGFNRLSCKYFHLTIYDRWGCLWKGSLALMFVRKILKDYGAVLEEFVISPESKLEGTLDEILQDCTSLPTLKMFSFTGSCDEPWGENYNVIQTVVSSAPNLQEVHALWDSDLEDMLKGRSIVLVPYNRFHAFHFEYSESFIPKLKLKKMDMDDIRDCSVEKFHRIVPLLLKTSRIALQSLTINPVVALPLMLYGICLENVTKLKIDIGWRRPCHLLPPGVAPLFKAFDFTGIFPKLEKVTVRRRHGEATPGQIREFVRQRKALPKKPMTPGLSANVKGLSLFKNCLIEDSTATLFAEMFPSIERLSVDITQELEASCGFIWEYWKDLKELEIKFERKKENPRLPNLDSIFCGIFPEEVAQLRQKDDEYLKCVNIVPIKPSFTCLKNLEKFEFVFLDDYDLRAGRRKNPKFLFSEVTGWIAFARCPALSVTIEYSKLLLSERALSPMKPFASVGPIDFKKRSIAPV